MYHILYFFQFEYNSEWLKLIIYAKIYDVGELFIDW